MRQAHLLAVDGGNSKTDLLLAGRDGSLLAYVRGESISHQAVGWSVGARRLHRLVAAASAEAGLTGRGHCAQLGSFCLAGADSRHETTRLTAALREVDLVDEITVLNDTRAALRAGSRSGWGVAVICGSGVNAVGVAPDGRIASLPALGNISGDWGGGRAVGEAGLAAAIRGRDGRGPRTSLERSVPAHFGMRRPLSVTWALYRDRIAEPDLRQLSPVVFAAATNGDAVAAAIVRRLADELATMAIATLRRLRLMRREVDVVLAGGVVRTENHDFFARIDERVRAAAPNARVHRLTEPPVVGAALLGMDRIRHPAAAEARLRREVSERSPTAVPG